MGRILLFTAASALLTGCAAMGVDTNADPAGALAREKTASADSGQATEAATDRGAGVVAKPLRPIAQARAAPSSHAVPTYYVEKGCKTASKTPDSSGYDTCVREEVAAKDKVTKEWKGYEVQAFNDCVPATRDPSNSYVELMTCFEMLDWIKNPESIGGVTGTGAMHAVNFPPPQPEPTAESMEQSSSASEAPTTPSP